MSNRPREYRTHTAGTITGFERQPTVRADAPKAGTPAQRLFDVLTKFEKFLERHPKWGPDFREAKFQQFLKRLPKEAKPSLQEKITGEKPEPTTKPKSFRERVLGTE